jgi:magnesium-transporting ATPase (P-type)
MLTHTLANNSLKHINSKTETSENNNPTNNKSIKIFIVIIFLLIICLIIFAWYRAYKCSNNTPDSRAIHFLFATTDPLLYIIFSYAIPGMCGFK